MRNKKRIEIVLEKIDWKKFIQDNCGELTEFVINEFVQHLINNTQGIKNFWLNNPDLRLGQLLINEGYLPDYPKLYHVEEVQWLIDNKLCKVEEIRFWGKTRDKFKNKLLQTEYILLKDLDDAHISAILDWCDEHNIKIEKDYKEYFEQRITELKKIN